MFIDRDTLHTSLMGLVGFHNADDPNYPTLAPSLLTSRSNRYFNDVHSLITIENLDQSLKNFSAYNYPSWSAGTYTIGQKVAHSGSNYEVNTTSTTEEPGTGSDWTVLDELSDFLIKAVYRGIDNMLDEYANEKKLRARTKAIFNDVLLFNGAGNYRQTQANEDKFVGLRIRMRKGERHLVTILNKIGHQFDQAFSGLTLKLYHSSQQAAIATWSIDHTTAKNNQWTSLSSPSNNNNLLRYLSDDHDAGGDFYIGYKQSELAALPNAPKAINKDVYWKQKPCDCDKKWSDYYKQYSPFVDVTAFSVLESEMPGDVLFDPTEINLTDVVNYGLNLNLTTKCDLAPFFLQEEDTLSEALAYSVGKVLLEAIAYSTRKGNTINNSIRQEAKKELFQHAGAWGTVHDRAEKAVKALAVDFSDMNDSCMPKDNDTVLDIDMGSW